MFYDRVLAVVIYYIHEDRLLTGGGGDSLLGTGGGGAFLSGCGAGGLLSGVLVGGGEGGTLGLLSGTAILIPESVKVVITIAILCLIIKTKSVNLSQWISLYMLVF